MLENKKPTDYRIHDIRVGLRTCDECRRKQKSCPAPVEGYESCSRCQLDGLICSFVNLEAGPPPASSISEMMKRHLQEDLSRSSTASSSVDSCWEPRSWATTAPSSYSSNGGSVPSFRGQNGPITPPDSGACSYTDAHVQLFSPLQEEAIMEFVPWRVGRATPADSGLSSREPSRPSSPLTSPTRGRFRVLPSKRRAQSPDTKTRLVADGQSNLMSVDALESLHGVMRPQSLKNDLIKKRNRRSEDMSTAPYRKNSDDLVDRERRHASFISLPRSNIREKKHHNSVSTRTLLHMCTQQCGTIAHRLEELQKIDQRNTINTILPMSILPISLSVVKLRLHLWGQIIMEGGEGGLEREPGQTLVKINGITCELDVIVYTLFQETHDDMFRVKCSHPPRAWEKAGKLCQELITLIHILHSELAPLWQESTQWALLSNLLVHQSPAKISEGLRPRLGGDLWNLFALSLGPSPEVPKNLSSMSNLLDNMNGTTAPMSYEYGLLDPNGLVDEGWYDPGIRVYIKRGSKGSPGKGLISVDIVACNGGETPKQAMDSQSALILQKRLQLPKPEEFRVLALAGYLENTANRQVEILYHTPEWAAPPYAPISLFTLAAEDKLPTSMSTRVLIARKLAGAVLHFHASDWIHGNIIDRNIIFFTARGATSGPNLLEPFLCNFATHPVREASKSDSSRAQEECRRARGHDIYQLAWVILKLVLGDEVVRQLRIFELSPAPTTTEFENIISQSAMRLLKQPEPAVLFKHAVMNCISGSAALEGIIEQDYEFKKRSGFYWRVMRPLDHCLELLVKHTSSTGTQKRSVEFGPFTQKFQPGLPHDDKDRFTMPLAPSSPRAIERHQLELLQFDMHIPTINFATHRYMDIELEGTSPTTKQTKAIVDSSAAAFYEGSQGQEDTHLETPTPITDPTPTDGDPEKPSAAVRGASEKMPSSNPDTPMIIETPKKSEKPPGLCVTNDPPVPDPPHVVPPVRNPETPGSHTYFQKRPDILPQGLPVPRPPIILQSSPKKRIYPVSAPAGTIDHWQNTLLPKLESLLTTRLPPTESASIDLLGIGHSRDSSIPTIVITCSSVGIVKSYLRKHFDYDENTFDLKIRPGSVRRSTGRRARRSRSTGGDCVNRKYQEKPLSGASIGACLDGKPLPPGTYGGLILVDGMPYGMTVHHLLDPESEGEEEEIEDDEQDPMKFYEYGSEVEGYSQFSSNPTDSDVDSMPVYWDDSEIEDDESEVISNAEDIGLPDPMSSTGTATPISEDISFDIGDIPGLPLNHGKNIIITQPAQDDVDVLLPSSTPHPHYKLGTILASSGIRRVRFGADKHEMDWALVQIEKQRLVARNIIRGGGKYRQREGPDDLEPCAIVPMAELSELRVHATGRTSGLQGGMISRAMSSVRLHGRETFSKSWHVVGNLGIPGDSGSWVVDNDNGRICGHVLARCSYKRVSYIVPMELLLADIKETLGAESVRLPSVATEVDQYLLDEVFKFAQYKMVDTNPANPQQMERLLRPGNDGGEMMI